MKNNKIRLKIKILSAYVIGFVLIGIILTFFSVKTDAALSLTADPTIIRIYATTPSDISANLAIQNLDTKPVILKIILKPFVSSEKENGEVKYPQSSSSNDLDFLQKIKIYDGDKLLNDSFILAPKQRKKLTLKVNIPKDYTSSDYYFSVIFLSVPEERYESNRSYISGGITSNILLSMAKDTKAQGEIEEFKAPAFVKSGPVAFDVKIKNKSKNFITPWGRLLVKNMFGQTVGNINLTPTNILANSSRFITNQNEAVKRLSKEGSPEKPKVFWSDSFIIGYYTAELTISLSDQGPILTKKTSFLVFPIIKTILLTVSLSFLLFLIKRTRKRQINR